MGNSLAWFCGGKSIIFHCRNRNDLAQILGLLKTQIDPALLVKKDQEEGSSSNSPNPDDEEKKKKEGAEGM